MIGTATALKTLELAPKAIPAIARGLKPTDAQEKRRDRDRELMWGAYKRI